MTAIAPITSPLTKLITKAGSQGAEQLSKGFSNVSTILKAPETEVALREAEEKITPKLKEFFKRLTDEQYLKDLFKEFKSDIIGLFTDLKKAESQKLLPDFNKEKVTAELSQRTEKLFGAIGKKIEANQQGFQDALTRVMDSTQAKALEKTFNEIEENPQIKTILDKIAKAFVPNP